MALKSHPSLDQLTQRLIATNPRVSQHKADWLA
jgi:hypothetical protein